MIAGHPVVAGTGAPHRGTPPATGAAAATGAVSVADWNARYDRLWAWMRCPCCGRHWPIRRPEAERGELGSCDACRQPRVLASRPPDDHAVTWANQDHICAHYVTEADKQRAKQAREERAERDGSVAGNPDRPAARRRRSGRR